jgi:hypothetical protein
MPSPFPGINPYLESARFWRDVHQSLIYCCRRALNRTLPAEFVARIDERLYVEGSERAIPDVAVIPRIVADSTPSNGGVAVSSRPQTDVADVPDTVLDYPEEITESFITITPARKPEHIITAIEILSPKNKQMGAGRRSYQQKQYEFFESGVHLLEIDLLRGGAHTVAVSQERLQVRYGSWDYLICLSRADRRFEYDVWRLTLRDHLPRVLIPLQEGYSDIALDLQQALDQTYDEGAFDRSLDYRSSPPRPFSDEDSVWANTLLQAKGMI